MELPDFIKTNDGHYKDFKETVTRYDFEKITEPLLERARVPLLMALEDNQIQKEDLDDIVLIGGGTKMPMIHAMLERFFNRTISNFHHPEEAVAMGAVIYGAQFIEDTAPILAEKLNRSFGIVTGNNPD
ncbi:hypothetical protein FACS1894166_10200 [Bacilli bacterium]|nr:hypothetical protein FACS1894166_10200 [Bacilli bacterium]